MRCNAVQIILLHIFAMYNSIVV